MYYWLVGIYFTFNTIILFLDPIFADPSLYIVSLFSIFLTKYIKQHEKLSRFLAGSAPEPACVPVKLSRFLINTGYRLLFSSC